MSSPSAPIQFESRIELLHALPRGGVVAEIGVAKGTFSSHILRITKPISFHLIDPWMYQPPECYCDAKSPDFSSQSAHDDNYSYVCRRFQKQVRRGQISIHRQFSVDALTKFPDQTFDWIYVDGNHSYNAVMDDLNLCQRKLKSNGLIVGDDYIESMGGNYGVIEAVDEFCRKNDWSVIAFAHNPTLDRCYDLRNFILAPQSHADTLKSLLERTGSSLGMGLNLYAFSQFVKLMQVTGYLFKIYVRIFYDYNSVRGVFGYLYYLSIINQNNKRGAHKS